jgi:hypothetical protein
MVPVTAKPIASATRRALNARGALVRPMCSDCNHPRSPGRGCLFCVGKRFCAAAVHCPTCTGRSVAGDPRARGLYHPLNQRPPAEMARSSNDTMVRWHCCDCAHDWRAAPFSVAAGTGCPFCAARRFCPASSNCQPCLAKSVAGDARAFALYHPNNLRPASEVARHSSDRRVRWLCSVCSHGWAAAPKGVALGQGGVPGAMSPMGCPFCAGVRLCSAAMGCLVCRAKSVAGDERTRGLYHPANPRPVAEVARSAGARVQWRCGTCTREWRARPTDVTAGGGCPACVASAAERAVARFLADDLRVAFGRERRFAWCRDRRELPFDFCIDDRACLIEVDGLQHFVQWDPRHDLEYTRRHDALKMHLALANGFSVVRVLARAVRVDGPGAQCDWRGYLRRALHHVQRRAMRDPPVVILPNCIQYRTWWESGIGARTGCLPVFL